MQFPLNPGAQQEMRNFKRYRHALRGYKVRGHRHGYDAFRRNRGYRWFKSKRSYRRPVAVNINNVEASYLNHVLNPFGNSTAGNFSGGGRIPDATSPLSAAMTLTSDLTMVATADNVQGYMKVYIPDLTSDMALVGATAAAGVDQPTHLVNSEWAQVDSLQGLSFSHYRVVGVGLKVLCTSVEEKNQGILRGGNHCETLTNGALASAYDVISSVKSHMEAPYFGVTDGITVRYVPDKPDDLAIMKFETMTGYDQGGFDFPAVVWEGLAVGTTLHFSGIIHLEMIGQQQKIPLELTPSPVSAQWIMLYSIVTNPLFSPIVTKGRSFRAFLRSSGYWIKRITRWAARYGPTAVRIGRFVGSRLAAL